MQRQLYPDDWKQLVQKADLRARDRCEACSAVLGNLSFLPLHTSQVNHDPENPQTELRKLCPRCHAKTHPWIYRKRSGTDRLYQPIALERVFCAARCVGLSITPTGSGKGSTWKRGELFGAASDELDAASQALHYLRLERQEQEARA